MNPHPHPTIPLSVAVMLMITALSTTAAPPSPNNQWQTVVNSNDPMPNASERTFNSFNQPSVNADALVVFRARSRGGPPLGPPARGIYTRDMSRNGPIRTVAGHNTPVPEPNNLGETFVEFPSIPRIAIDTDMLATRGNHRPVWRYLLGDDSETRAGTSGIYVKLDRTLLTGATKLGAVPPDPYFDFPVFSVPGTILPTAFDVFPGAPAITDDGVIAFKGNYTDSGLAKTGVFYRDLLPEPAGGPAHTQLIANADTPIPEPGDCLPGTTFGSTAPPSAADGSLVFVGVDNEDDPTCGGLYLAPLSPGPPLATLVALGSPVPEMGPADTFNRLGEGLSFDGRFVAFWGAWGEETFTLRLYCPGEGNRARRAFCNHTGDFAYGNGDPNSICDDASDATERCYQEFQIPLKQGIFIHDTRRSLTYRIADTVNDFDDFLYWVYSGRVPGSGEGEEEDGDGEPPRWRASTFVAVSSAGSATWTVFKARTGEPDPFSRSYEHPLDGVYLSKQPGRPGLERVVDTLTPGEVLDPEAPVGSLVTEIGIERDGLRGKWLAISARMGDGHDEDEEGLAGIYLTRVR